MLCGVLAFFKMHKATMWQKKVPTWLKQWLLIKHVWYSFKKYGWNEKENKGKATIKPVSLWLSSSVSISGTTNRQKMTWAHHWPYEEQEPRPEPRIHCRCNWQADGESRGEPPRMKTDIKKVEFNHFCVHPEFKKQISILATYLVLISNYFSKQLILE